MTGKTGVSTSLVFGAAFAALVLISSVPAAAVEIKVLTAARGLPSNWVTAVAAAPDGKIWIGTGDAGVFFLDPETGKGKGFRAADGLSSDKVTSIALFQGKVFVGTASGISVFDGGKWSVFDKVENVTLRNVRLAASPDGRQLWACAVYLAGGTVRFDGRGWKFMGGEGRGLFNDIQGFAFLPEGVLMAAGSGFAYLHKETDVVPLVAGLPPVNVFSAGTRGGAWLLGTSRGLFEYRGGWTSVPLPEGFAQASVFSIASAGDAVVLGTDRGLVRLAPGGAEALGPEAGLPSSRVVAVASGRGVVAAATAGGLVIVPDGGWGKR